MNAYNFGGSGYNLTNLYQGRWLEAWVIKWTLVFQGVPLQNLGGQKCSKFGAIFGQLSTLIANISGTHQHVENLNST